MGTVYIDRKGLYVTLDGNALAFYANGTREGIVPLAPVKRVVVVGQCVIETPVLHKLSDLGIAVVFLSGRRARFRGMLHGRLHNNGFLRVKQYEKALSDFGDLFARELVVQKVTSQAELLRSAANERPDLRFPLVNAAGTLDGIIRNLQNEQIVLEQVRGFEGGAAAAYFSAYTKLFPESLHFTKRTRRPPEDPVNAMLSLCYTIVHFECVREIEVIGLDPTIGFYHQFEYGRESLACDLVELYRPDVDRFVWDVFRDRSFTDRDFAYEEERPGCYLNKAGRQRFFFCYETWARSMRPRFVETVRNLARRRMDGQDPLPD